MAKSEISYSCDHCSRKFKTLELAQEHEQKCSKNLEYNSKLKEKLSKEKELSDAFENIRVTARSPEHLIQMVEEKFLEFGVEIKFTSYPSSFNISVSNSHNSPKGYSQNFSRNPSKGVPTGYPGWYGRFEGTVKVLNTKYFKKDTRFSDLRGDHFSISHNHLWFMNTGSGSYGERFSGEGILWLYDFPKMHEEFKSNGGEFDVLNNEFTNVLKKYTEEYHSKCKDFISKDENFCSCLYYSETLCSLQDKLSEIKESQRKYLINEFNKKFGKNVPLPNSAFVPDTKKLQELHSQVSFNSSVTEPSLSSIFSEVERLTTNINKYIENNAEFFI